MDDEWRACMYIRMIMKKMKAEDNIKNKTSQNRQKKTINSIANQSSSKNTWKFRNERERENEYYNIARVLALYKSYWAAMNKIFIYARPCVNKMT